MKLKYYLKGLGVGLIVATVILTIAYNVGTLSAESKIHETDKETEGSVIAYTKETESGTEQTTEQNVEPTSSEEETTKQETESQTAEDVTQTQTNAPETPTKGEKVSITIKNVYYATQASDILYRAGVIDNKTEFTNYMMNSGYATKIKEGVYEITKGDTYENIAKIITRTK